MAASGYSPISLYYSTTASATPTNTNLVNGELALNITDGKLFYKDNAGTVQTLATKAATSGSFSTTTISTSETLSYGTANGVAYLNGSKVVTTGSALTFDGTNLNVGSATFPSGRIRLKQADDTTKQKGLIIEAAADDSLLAIGYDGSAFTFNPTYNTTGGYKPMAWWVSGSEAMRLTSTGLGIGTSNPVTKLDIVGGGATGQLSLSTNSTNATTKEGKLVVPHYTNAEESFLVLYPYSTSTVNEIYYGGGSSSQNTATGHYWMTAANNTTVSGTVRMTLDSSGNLGLGVTPSAWWSSTKAIQIGAGGVISGRTDTAARNYFASNAYLNSTPAWTYIATNYATRYEQNDGQHQWFTAPSGTAGNAITFTQAMTLDASGRLALGSTGILGGTNRASFVNDTTAKGVLALQNTSSSGYSAIELYDNGGTQQGAMGWGNGSVAVTGAASATYLYSTGAITFLSGGTTERARIDSSGNLLVGKTSGPNGGHYFYKSSGTVTNIETPATTSVNMIVFVNGNGNVGTVTTNGSATAYNTSSDYRLKHDIAPMTGALAKVAALKPVTYKWNADDSDGEGFIAHELAEVVPQCVTGEKDAVDEDGNPVYQGIDTSFLVATLTAAIKEQQALIQTLTERITALESK